MAKAKSGRFSWGVVLFAIVFLLVGLLMWFGALNQFISFLSNGDSHHQKNFFILLIFGAPFALIGGGILLSQRRQRKTEQEYPDEPWMRNEEWRSGTLKSCNRAGACLVWGFVGIWNVVAIAHLIMMVATGTGGGLGVLLSIGLFLGPGLFIMIPLACYYQRHYRRSGETICRLKTLPGVIGGKLEAEIRLPSGFWPEKGVEVTLECDKDPGSESSNKQIWSQTQHLEEAIDYGEDGIWIPVSFIIPSDCTPCSTGGSYPIFSWSLCLKAELPGIDPLYTFSVPVFRTSESREDVNPDMLNRSERESYCWEDADQPRDELAVYQSSGLEGYSLEEVLQGTNGKLVDGRNDLEVSFGLKKPGAKEIFGWVFTIAVLVILFVAFAWAGGIIIISCFHAVAVALLTYATTYRGRIMVNGREIGVENRYFGIPFTRWIPFRRILGIETPETKGLTVRLRNGQSYSVGWILNNKVVAKRIAEQLMQFIELDEQ